MKYTQQMIDDLILAGKLRETDFSNCDLSNLSLKKTNLVGTNLFKANLAWANLSYTNLSDANLEGANLFAVNLSSTNLSYTNLSKANLSYVNLPWANLTGTNLSCANLENINIRYCIGNQKEICNISSYFWDIVFTKDVLAIGCKQYPMDEWRNFTDEEINSMHDDALGFWTENKEAIFNEIEKHFGGNE